MESKLVPVCSPDDALALIKKLSNILETEAESWDEKNTSKMSKTSRAIQRYTVGLYILHVLIYERNFKACPIACEHYHLDIDDIKKCFRGTKNKDAQASAIDLFGKITPVL